MVTKQKILEDLHPLAIIREVEKWPVLYRGDSRDRGNKPYKSKVWKKVAEKLFEDWNTLSDKEKENKVKGVKRRWRNLRVAFKRQVELNKKVKTGLETSKSQYIFFKDMEFLLRTDGEKNLKSSSEGPSVKREIEVPVIDDVAQSSCAHDLDEDRHFVLSLIPTLKKLSDEDKLTTKMEILKVLRKASQKSSSSDGQIFDESVLNNLKSELDAECDDSLSE
ncbi:uncharacterized protein LOC121735848 [Aricia agestis]|uniref:uncharacterized protein LOC121735848 n=1 Tax=Aricia agestis TaxID=91739 RepID=UPI001C20BA28|nr:uncharacterized protein LOC121735848 [Aricia agestis]